LLGLTFVNENRLRCFLITGKNAENMPTIVMGGYEELALTSSLTVKIFITWLTSLPVLTSMTVKVGVKEFYPSKL